MAPYDDWNHVEDDEDEELQDDVNIYQAAAHGTRLLGTVHKRWNEGFLPSLKTIHMNIRSEQLANLRLEAKKGWVEPTITNVEVWMPDFGNDWVEQVDRMGTSVKLLSSDGPITKSHNSTAELDRRRYEILLKSIEGFDPVNRIELPDPPF